MRIHIVSSFCQLLFVIFFCCCSAQRQPGNFRLSDQSLTNLQLPGTYGQIYTPVKQQGSLHFKGITWKANELLRACYLQALATAVQMKSCFPSGLKCRHGSAKIPNFWCQVSHQQQINHPQNSMDATVQLPVTNSSCCALSLSSSGGIILHISVFTGGTEDTWFQWLPALSLGKRLFALPVLPECPFNRFYSTAIVTSLEKKKKRIEWKETHMNWHE